MRRYLFTRLAQNILTFFLFLTCIYFLLDAQPGDFADLYLSDPRLTPEMREVLRANLGLDKPVTERYMIWLDNLFHGDLGISWSNYPRQVLDVIVERAPRTITLFITSIALYYYFGFATGKMLAWRRGGTMEYAATVIGVALYTVFLPWFALMMVYLFGFGLKIFPIGKFLDPLLWQDAPVDANYLFHRMLVTLFIATVFLLVMALFSRKLNPAMRRPANWMAVLIAVAGIVLYWSSTGVARFALDIVYHLVLPILTLTLVNFAGTMLLTRNSMLETLREDYIVTAKAKGLPDKVIRDKHAARNAMLPVATSFILALAFVLDGGVITESTFAWPGMGLTLLKAAQTNDIPMVIGGLVFTGTLALSGHLIADIVYAFIDPRIRYSD
jgi:peptide/nickel transport system permease protein